MTLTKRKDVDLQNVNFMKIHFTKANSIVCFYRKNVGIGILGRLYDSTLLYSEKGNV